MITDHKALEAIFNNPRTKPPARIERWMMRLQAYNFKVIYQKGLLNTADYLSRHPGAEVVRDHELEETTGNYVNFVANHAIPKSMTLEEVKKSTENDSTIARVKKVYGQGNGTTNVRNYNHTNYAQTSCLFTGRKTFYFGEHEL